MRLFVSLAVLLLVAVSATAQDKVPGAEERIAKLEERVRALEEEAAELRREIEELKRAGAKVGLPEGALWAIEMNSDLKGSGAIADVDGDGRLEVVFGSYFGEQHVFCVRAQSGEVMWKHKSDAGPLDASIAIDDLDNDGNYEIFSADSSSGHFYDLAPDGKLNWKFKLPNSTDSPVAIADLDGDRTKEFVVGSMWQRDGMGAVSCYSAKKQKLLWERKYKGCIQSEPVLTDLNGDKTLDVIVTTWRGDHGIHAISGKDGKDLWTFTTAGDEKSMGMYHGVALSADEKTVFMATCQGDVYALDTAGNQLWTKHYDDYLFSPITVADVNGDRKEELVFGGRNLYCLAAEDGAELWKQALDGGLDRGVAVTDVDGDGDMDVIYNDQCAVVARDGRHGVESFRFDATYKGKQWEEISSAPLVADFDGDGVNEYFLVVGVGTSTDEFRGNYGRAMAIKLKGKGPAWTTFRSNLRRTGNPAHGPSGK
ncbi:MAG: PQQ-binding-like beta-propeller repeat protein [Planctomycetes bacterium]|nr:PQQ-binding-like beta-propeller repeat protein [Planctomycetota bacterium]MCB9935926.1 PQQ-binding-like beta-propeller repeat protein [Planctomycetota bacterium]